MNKTAPTLANYEKALHRMLDENAALQVEIVKLRTELSNLVDWVMGDKDALTCLQAIYNSATTSETNRSRLQQRRLVMNGRSRRPAGLCSTSVNVSGRRG